MRDLVLLYVGGALPIVWGIAHLFPTRNVVAGFGAISVDNRRILTMEWLTEGVALIALGGIVCLVTAIDPWSPVSRARTSTSSRARDSGRRCAAVHAAGRG